MNKEQAMAIVRLFVPLVVYAATAAGVALDADLVYCIMLGLVGIAATVWTWWKNNNVTDAAQEAQKYLDAIKAGYEGIPEEWESGIVEPLKAAEDEEAPRED